MDVGQAVPEFSLKDLGGKVHALSDVRGRILVLVFWSAECPWSVRADDLIETWRGEWETHVEVWRVASNANEEIALMKQAAVERRVDTVLIDEEHRLADSLEAMTTPHCYVIDEHGFLRYRGGLDDTTFRQRQATRFYLADAVAAVMAGKRVDPADTPGYGCTIVRVKPPTD